MKEVKKETGFTLIELLAVIVILAVIALIATPIIIGIIDDAKVSAAKQSANGVLESARLYHQSSLLKDITFDGTTNEYPEVSKIMNGKQPENSNAKVLINKEGEIALAVVYNGLCFVKGFNTPIQNGKKTDSCTVEGSLAITEDYAIVNFYDWDNTLIGSTIVPKGDARGYVNEYVLTHFIHPDLQTNKNYSSLERKDSYRGEYPYISPTEGDTYANGKDYPLTNGLDYVFYGKDIDKDYPYVSGWTEVNKDTVETTWTNIGSKLEENNLHCFDFSKVENDSINVKASYKPGTKMELWNFYNFDPFQYGMEGDYVFTITFNLNRNSQGYGVQRAQTPLLRVEMSRDGESSTYTPLYIKNHDKIEGTLKIYNRDENHFNMKVMLGDTEYGKHHFWYASQVSGNITIPNNYRIFCALNNLLIEGTKKYKGITNGYNNLENTIDYLGIKLNVNGDQIQYIYKPILLDFIHKAMTTAITQNQVDSKGNAILTWYQMQYAVINKGAYVSAAEAKTWCEANLKFTIPVS